MAADIQKRNMFYLYKKIDDTSCDYTNRQF